MEKTKVAIVGLGTVGQGVAKAAARSRRPHRPACRPHVVARKSRRPRSEKSPRLRPARRASSPTNVDEVINDREIKVVAQLIGGLEPARTIMLQLLESGKDVVTANKALLAEHGPELFDRARELGRSIAFEASVAGGIPIIANISQCLSANQILSLDGILNGTSNFILSKWTKRALPTPTPSRKPNGWAMPRPTRRWTSTAATPPKSWRSWPIWPSALASIGKTFRAWASIAR